MKVVILAGGFGTRLGEYTESIPKPMVPIGGRPILWHIMQRYASYGYNEFIIALGYKASIIKEYFLSLNVINSDFTVDLSSGNINYENNFNLNWKITLVDTGINTMTGGRLKRLERYLGEEPFMLTYGDGVSEVDINKLVSFHNNHGKQLTVTAVHPAARFGEIDINEGGMVTSFKEKPQITTGWINGGFMVCKPEFISLISEDSTILERSPMETAAKNGEMMAYKHKGFWQCMDTKRDKDMLEDLWKNNKRYWIKK